MKKEKNDTNNGNKISRFALRDRKAKGAA